MENWSQWVYDYLGMSHSLQYKIVATIIVGIILFVLKRLTFRLFQPKTNNLKKIYNWEKSVSYGMYLLFFILISPIWIKELQSLGTFLGLLSAGLAVALKDPIVSLFGWIYIMVRKPFEMGDRIQIEGSEGDILDISFFKTTMLEIKNWVKADQSTGRIIHIPNGFVFTKPIANYNQAMNYIWNEIPIMITFESNWEKAKQILLEIEDSKLKQMVEKAEEQMDHAKKTHHFYYANITPTVYTNIQSNGVLLTLRYLCNPRKRRESEQIAIEGILNEFAKHKDITFAYPTTRFFDAVKEQKKEG